MLHGRRTTWLRRAWLITIVMMGGCWGDGERVPSIMVTAPNGGEYWIGGGTETVTWSTTGSVGDMMIELSVNNGADWSTLVPSTPNDGTESVSIPDTPSDQCLVRVSETDGQPTDTSDGLFEIGPAFIRVTSPNGGEDWYVGETHDIIWESAGVSGSVVIGYARFVDPVLITSEIATVPASDGSYSWELPDENATQCLISIWDGQPGGLADQSDGYFTVSRRPIAVISPNGGEALAVGADCNITWSVFNITGDVDIHYSIDSGATYPNLIATVPADNGSYAWTVPAENSAQCRVRVQEAGGGGESDESDADFAIGPGSGGWAAMGNAGAPGPGRACWTGSEMLVWAGDEGGLYDPSGDSWTSLDLTDAPVGRAGASAVWAGSKMIVWGGRESGAPVATGAAYDPVANSWTPTGTSGDLPAAREHHSAVWTGTEMIVWGGGDGTDRLGTGARYDPSSGSWTAIELSGAPTARANHGAVWTGDEMIIWGGVDDSGDTNSGGRYDPGADSWLETTTNGAPAARKDPSVTWAGSRMVVWGGWQWAGMVPGPPPVLLRSGGCYDPSTDSWTPTSESGAPTARTYHAAVSTGAAVMIWAGTDSFDDFGSPSTDTNSGAVYEVSSNTWVPTATSGAPSQRFALMGVWTGTEVIVWGGWHYEDPVLMGYSDGGRYTP